MDKKEQKREIKKRQKLLGADILGWLNLSVFGLLSLGLVAVYSFSPEGIEKMRAMFQQTGIEIDISEFHVRIVLIIEAIMALLFISSGIGILKKKEWGRVFTVYFAFIVVIIMMIAVIMKPVSFLQMMPQIAYAGTLIMYFTNKNVEKNFRKKCVE